ncbi:hypothetical protein PR048_004716 [Dryococelus australis]|uniref:Maturase K n=1 Tax=Dryococelus australis TaxID=614101 RepID=A0ABQ9I669_9NEOP|nr:hypothetical protein PR048_004716 [Dryococelus australis]
MLSLTKCFILLKQEGCDSHLPVVKRLLEQYVALTLYFQGAVFSNKLASAQHILTWLRDPTCKLYLQILEFKYTSGGIAVDLKQFKLKCIDFFIEGGHEIYQRFPFKPMQKLKLLDFLNHEVVKGRSFQSIAAVFPFYTHLIK